MWLDLGKCHLDGFTLWHKKLFWPQRPSSGCQEPGDHCTMYTQADITRIFSNLMSACLPRLSQSALGNIVWCELVSVERVNGGRGQRDAFTSPSPRLTRERGEGGILIDTLQNLGLHSFLTQDAFAHLNSRGRSAKFKYLKESELTCWADKHFVTKEKVKF